MKRCVTRDDGSAADVLFRAYSARLGSVSRADFDAMTRGWELALLTVDGEVAGAAVRRAGELHIGVLPAWRGRWASRPFIRAILDWAGESGPVTTGVMAGNEDGRRLVEGVGFRPVKTTERGTQYALPG